jgi:ABC-type sulfate transport system permease subunit
MHIRFGLISKMVLAILFGILALVSLYMAYFYVSPVVLGLLSNETLPHLSAADYSQVMAARRWAIIFAIGSVILSSVFSWLCYRFAKKWRQF